MLVKRRIPETTWVLWVLGVFLLEYRWISLGPKVDPI